MCKILITGVGGNVGQYLGNDLAGAGYEVIGLYRNSMPENIDYKLIKADISEPLERVARGGIEDIDVVIHCAASILGDTKTLIRDNIEATKNIVCWAERTGVRKFVYMSSVAVYGPVDGELSETSGTRNLNSYGMTKHIGEAIVKESDIPEKLIIQLPKMIGPYVHMDNTTGSGFLTMTKKILMGETVICFIPEMKYNNYLHVSELGAFLKKLLGQDEWAEHETVLLGAYERLTMMEILRIMRDEIHSTSEIIAQSNGTTPAVSLIDISRARALGFAPCNASDMLRRFIREICSY